MKISLFYGKQTLSASGKAGYVISVNVSGVTIKCLVCADANEKEFAVNFNDLKSVKSKIVYPDFAETKIAGNPLRLGKPVFDFEGAYLGKLTDFTVEGDRLTFAHVGNKKFAVDDIVCGDAVIVKNSARILKSNVTKNGKVIIRRGTPLSPEIIKKAQESGECVQTNLKTI